MASRKATMVVKEPFRFIWEKHTNMHRTLLMGYVVSKDMKKTAKVQVKTMSLHPALLKYYAKTKNYFAHDPEEKCNLGDLVLIRSLKYKKKSWATKAHVVSEVVEAAPIGVNAATKKELPRHHFPLKPSPKL